MNILLVSATIDEIKPFFFGLSKEYTKEKRLYSIASGALSLDILIAGVGMVPMTYHLTRLLSSRTYDMAINAGIAGAFNRQLELGQPVHVVSDSFPELGAEDGEEFLSMESLNLIDPHEFPFSNGIITAITQPIPSVEGLFKARGITVNKVHGNALSISALLKRISPDVETMEGAAFIYTCMQEQVPCCQVKAISNYVERRNRDGWNIPLAVKNINEFLYNAIDELREY